MKLPRSVHNWLSYTGATIAALAFIVFVFLVLLNTFSSVKQAPYAGIVIFAVVPAFLLFGLALIPVGMFREWQHLKRTGKHSIPRFPVIDLNQPHYRNATAIFTLGSIVLLFLTVYGSFEAYEATESVVFCGGLCHNVMQPEYTTYKNSPHARVRCVDCHVGPGADWWVKSKLSGTYQVYAVLFDKYPRPIPAPIASLRPARETCEQCHWPEHFSGGQQTRLVHYLSDEENTRWEIDMLLRVGGANPPAGHPMGIHWHIANRVEYIATDRKRQTIPWVRVTDAKTNQVKIYQASGSELSKEEIAQAEIRTMDCIDCHNRPTHIYHSPNLAVDLALEAGEIDSTLPFVKQTSVKLLAASYDSTESAQAAIADGFRRFYREKYPDLADTRRKTIDQAVGALQKIYSQNFFPHMKAQWSDYADNVGHLMFPGCFRCHDGQHEDAKGQAIGRECTTCHAILGQGKTDSMAYSDEPDGLEFQHPEDIGGVWRDMSCDECHTGTVGSG